MLNDLSELKAAEYNPRVISDKALEGLKYSLEEFGDISGIVFNAGTGNIVAGHQRVRALAEKYGNLKIYENKISLPNGENINIRVVNWSLEKEKAANIAANSDTIHGKWTSEAGIIIDEISLQFPDLYNNLNLDKLIIPELKFSDELIDVDRQSSDIPQKQRNSLKFGDIIVFISDEELEKLIKVYEGYIESNKNNFGFVHYLLRGEDEVYS